MPHLKPQGRSQDTALYRLREGAHQLEPLAELPRRDASGVILVKERHRLADVVFAHVRIDLRNRVHAGSGGLRWAQAGQRGAGVSG